MIIPLGPPIYIQFECKKLYRSRSNRKCAGICGGMSDLMNIDATIIRLMMLFTMILTGIFPILITYIVGAFAIPEQPEIK
ncbi:MAG: PspC domain-containing protein [Simkania negevensis]|nr:PspC domain-containing protein [Simkania negevensis]